MKHSKINMISFVLVIFYVLFYVFLVLFQLTKLCKQLDNIWSDQGPGVEVLFEWMQFLVDEILSFLEISSPFLLSRISLNNLREYSSDKQSYLYDIRARQDIASVDDLVNYLTVYDSHESIRQFNISYINCGVCFIEKLGKDCVQFQQCKHIYCAECITNYFIIQIRDGSVRSLNCPEDKCESQADPNLVKKLVPSEVYEQYDNYLLQSTLDCMEDMTYCPRKTCQTAVLLEPDSRNMGRCPGCKLVFCVFCKRTYHGITNCAINNKELLILRNEYLNGNEEVRNALEKKYGKKRLQTVVDEYYTEAWMEKFSKHCPSCKTSIEKINGCNKMVCLKCKCYFCWLCGKPLSHADPYIHFSDMKSPCYNKLFLGVDIDADDWSDDEFAEFW